MQLATDCESEYFLRKSKIQITDMHRDKVIDMHKIKIYNHHPNQMTKWSKI